MTRFIQNAVLMAICLAGLVHADPKTDNDQFKQLDQKTQKLKLRFIDFNRASVKYLANSKTPLAKPYQGEHLNAFKFNSVQQDFEGKHYLQAINRYHAGRDLGVISSQYEMALQVARIYLDYGLYDYAKRLITKLLGNEDSAVASMARYQLARHDYVKLYWQDALQGLQTVTDGLADDLLDEKRIMQGIILQEQKRHKDAIAVFSEVRPESEAYAYAQFNIAMSNLRQGWWSDAEDSINIVLARLTGDDAKSTDRQLIDRLYIGMGYAQLQRRYYREAYASLSKVGDGSVFAYKAKLGMGLVLAEQGNYQASLEKMYELLESYAQLMVTEEAHVVIPFLLESIESDEVAINFHGKSVRHYTAALQDTSNALQRLHRGEYDHELIAETTGRDAMELENKPAPGRLNRYVFELMSTGRWRESSSNNYDLREIAEQLSAWKQKLGQVGGYDPKIYKKLSDEIIAIENMTATLIEEYKTLLRQMVEAKLNVRVNYFTSYLNQAQFALARNYDKALGVEESVIINGKNINEAVVRQAYRDYLNNAGQGSINRRSALKRLAELEVDRYDQLLAEETSDADIKQQALTHLEAGIQLFNTVIGDYADHEKNDIVLYQLIDAYDKNQDRPNVVAAMQTLVDHYPQSPFYPQIQFKLGEEYLVGNQSIDAELAYSAAIQRGNDGSIYYRRALYNRGWSRLKQSLYDDALEDFFEVLEISEYGDYRKMSKANSELYEDVLRAVSLCFSNRGGLEPLNAYFTKNPDSQYASAIYRKLAEVYQQQNRRSDSANVYKAYIERYPLSPYAPQFSLKLIETWKHTKFKHYELAARKQFDRLFVLDGKFWEKNDITQYTNVREALKNNMLTFSAYYHSRFQNSNQAADKQQAKYWYERYFDYFPSDKESGKTHFLYAELLNDSGDLNTALLHYNKASRFKQGNDNNVEAAYAKIVTVDKLAKKEASADAKDKWLLEKTQHTLEFAKQFPHDRRTEDALVHVLERLYDRKLYKKAIKVADQIFILSKKKSFQKAGLIKANSLFELQEYADAEKLYEQVIAGAGYQYINKNELQERLASAIYKQGEFEQKSGDKAAAINHYVRVFTKTPNAKAAPIALFDAATLHIQLKSSANATALLEKMRARYPHHKMQSQVTQKLAILYMQESNDKNAAQEFEVIAKNTSLDKQTRMDALWQAAELNESSANTAKAIQLYTDYVHNFPQPFIEAMEARAKLVELNNKSGQHSQVLYWQREIINADAGAGAQRNERSRYLAAVSTLAIADGYIEVFEQVELVAPMKIKLIQKKKSMNKAVDTLLNVSAYSLQETTTEATFKIAKLYNEFGAALLNSERPGGLTEEELEQYDLLLEEQAFPFEEKAIEYYQLNTKLVKQGVFDQWVAKSYEQLASLVPSKYNKKEKLEPFIDIPESQAGRVAGKGDSVSLNM